MKTKTMKNIIKIISIFIILLHLPFTSITLAHPGRTDSNGGHWDRSSGTYHYHTGEYAGQSSSSSSSSEKSSWEKYKEERLANTTKKQNYTTKTENIQKDDSNLWSWISIILTVLIFGVPFGITILQLIVEFIKFIIKKCKPQTNNIIEKKEEPQKNTLAQNITQHIRTSSPQYICPKCGHKLVIKSGKYGKFVGCSYYPYCKYTKNINKNK